MINKIILLGKKVKVSSIVHDYLSIKYMHEIQNKLQDIIDNLSQEDFIFNFLLAYDQPKSTIARLKGWDLNKLQERWELLLRKKVFFKIVNNNLYESIDTLKKTLSWSKDNPRFIFVTDFQRILSLDTKNLDTLDIDFLKLPQYYDFFLPLVWVEKTQYQNEKIADIKAANNLARLFDEISKNNKHDTKEEKHALNKFLTRLLFCYFAEDTKIFQDGIFTNSLASHTQESWEDTHLYLEKLFKVLNLKNEERDNGIPKYFKAFPYVNWKLFETVYPIPVFTSKSRKILIDLWKLSWAEINPDIFWSMMQAVMDSEERSNMGSHYTSVPNIMKVINPLFLDDLRKEFEENIWNSKKLNQLHDRLWRIKFFDPACWSWNFLIITYKEIRKLEIEILKCLWVISLPNIKLSQFYWLEISDFARETAMLSLYLVEHQMNVLFEEEVRRFVATLPLKLWWNIVLWNTTRLDWEQVCPKKEWDEIYIMWNPPYLWARLQNSIQKEDINIAFWSMNWINNLDYISIWFYKSAKYIKNSNVKSAFVSTNSINQWEQVSLLWPHIFDLWIEIWFWYKSFKWNNNAKANAKVIVVIIWLRNKEKLPKYLYSENSKQLVPNINAYLVNWWNIIVKKLQNPLSNFPEMNFWSMANDWWYLLLNEQEKKELIKSNPESTILVKKFIWSQEFINNSDKYCLWISDDHKNIAYSIPNIKYRIEKCEEIRKNSKRWATNKLANVPYKFWEIRFCNTSSIIIPRVSSERRNYIPCWFLNSDSIISDSAFSISTSNVWLMWILTSRMHMTWVSAVAWRLKTDYRYSATLVYNTFPFPNITEKQKETITELGNNILDEREKHSEKTLAQMYDPDRMPEWLKQAHHELDLAIEKCYRLKPFESDEERLEYLFTLYEKMIENRKK